MKGISDKIIEVLRKYSIRKRIVVILIVSLLIYCLTIAQIANVFSKNLIDRYVNEYVKSTQEELVSSIQIIIEQVNMLTIRLRSNHDIYNLFSNKELTYEAKQNKMRQILQNTTSNDGKIGDVCIITEESDSNYEFYSYKSLMNVMDVAYLNKIKNSVMPVFGTMVQDEKGNYYLPFGVKLRNFYTGENIGYLVMYIREQAMCDIYMKVVDDWGYSFIISQNDTIISHDDKNKVGKVMFDTYTIHTNGIFEYKNLKYNGIQSIVAIYKFNESLKNIGIDWSFVSIIRKNELFSIIDKVNVYIGIIIIIMFILGTVFSVYILMKVTGPILRLSNKVSSFGSGNLNEPLIKESGDEIWGLETSFNKMVVDINELIEKNNLEKEKQREMELIALQAQINPHFLYNTLDAIGWIAKLKEQRDIELLVMELAKFFRLSLHKGEKFITVDEEIQLVQSFVIIEQTRRPNKFEVFYNVQEEMKSFKMLKIILQPLVENAIKHGIGQKRGKGTIIVNCYMVGDELRFEVIDDGAGFTVENTWVDRYGGQLRSGYGFRNVDERIKLEYGSEYGLNIESEIDKGTKVTVVMRIKPQDEL